MSVGKCRLCGKGPSLIRPLRMWEGNRIVMVRCHASCRFVLGKLFYEDFRSFPELQEPVRLYAQSPGDAEEYFQGERTDNVGGFNGTEMGAA